MMTIYENLIYSHENKIATITLNRPEVRNALNKETTLELKDAIAQAAKDTEIRVLILTGVGKGFCAGADLSGGPSGSAEDTEKRLNEVYKPMILNITEMEKPVISAVRGAAAGVGSAIAMACDLTIMSEDAFILEAFSNIGLIPDGGATWQLVQTIGYKRAYQLAIEAERIPAQRCFELGLTNKVVPTDQLMDEAKAWAERLVKRAPMALSLTKKAMHKAMKSNLGDMISYEANLQGICKVSEDHQEGVTAFLEKRIPEFKGE